MIYAIEGQNTPIIRGILLLLLLLLLLLIILKRDGRTGTVRTIYQSEDPNPTLYQPME